MRKLFYALLGLVLLVAAAFAAAFVFVDPAAISAALAQQAEAALGEPVELGEVDLRLFPMPAARVRDVVVGSGDQPLLRVDELRVRVSLPALLIGRVVLRALEVDHPVLLLQLDESGAPRLPGGKEEPARDADAAAEAQALAITSLRVSDGAVRAGPWRAAGIELAGGLELDGAARFTLHAELVDLARLRDVEIELEELFSGTPLWSVRGQLEQVDLAELGARLALEPTPAGRAAGRFAASGRSAELRGAELDLLVEELVVQSEAFALRGVAPLRAELGGRWSADLRDVEISVPDVLTKPRGAELSLEGELGPEPSLAALGPFTARVGPSTLHGRLALVGGVPELLLENSVLDLEPIAGWLVADPHPTRGRVRFEALRLVPAPLAVHGDATLEGIELPLPYGTLAVSGPLRGEGERLVLSPLDVRIGGQASTVEARYEFADGSVDLRTELADADFEALAGALLERSPITGTLTTRSHLRGPPALERLNGQGTFEIRDGQIRGFSLMKTVLGELSALPLLVARLGQKDLSRYDEEQFQRLAASFRLADAVVHLDDLVLEYRHATVELRGTVGVTDGALALSGRLLLSEELDAELAGEGAQGRTRVIPIEGVSGTVSSPRIRLDRRALSSALSTVVGGSEVRERLDEKLGPGGAEIVEDVLDKLFRGGGQK